MNHLNEKSYRTLSDARQSVWQARKAIFIGAVAGVLIASGFVYAVLPSYRAQIIVAPAAPMASANVPVLQGGGDNAMALHYMLQNIASGNATDFTQFESVYQGASVAAVLLHDEKIRAGLALDHILKTSLPVMRADPPQNSAALSEYISRRVHLEAVGATSLRRLVYSHPDPAFAMYFLGRIHRVADQLIRLKIRSEATKRVDYLRDAIAQSENPDNRRVLTALLMEQERLLMLVSIDSAYAASIVEPASAGSRPDWPRPLFVFSAFMVLGALAGFIAADIFRIFAPVRALQSPQRRWFRAESGNANRKPFSARNAAE